MAEAVKSQRELLVAAKIGVETTGDFSVYTDGKSLCFILKQLLINCAKYCRGCRVKISAEKGELAVADDGPGILPHELPRVTARGFTGAQRQVRGRHGHGAVYRFRTLQAARHRACDFFRGGQGNARLS